MINVDVYDISYNHDDFYAEEQRYARVLRSVEYKFTAFNNEFKLEGKMTLPTELTRPEAEQMIRGMLSND